METAQPVDSFVPYVGSDNSGATGFYCRFTSFPCKTRIFITEFIEFSFKFSIPKGIFLNRKRMLKGQRCHSHNGVIGFYYTG